MLSGRPRVASVCLRCRTRTNNLLGSHAQALVHPPSPNSRAQSTAAAVIEEHDEDARERQQQRRPSKRPKKRLRRVWKPSPVAELGVSSLGKPAEVLVLKDRDRHVLAATEDKPERSKASEPRILEALQAENLPLSSDNVKQSLDQISAPYRNRSKSLSTQDRTELKKKIVDGFTLQQLQSFCTGSDRHGVVSPPITQAGASKAERRAGSSPEAGQKNKTENKAAKIAIQRGKTDLVEYIIQHKWAIPSPEGEKMVQRMPAMKMKLEYILSCSPSSLKDYAQKFNVVLDISQDHRHINAKGELKAVLAAREAIESFLKDIRISRIRSTTTGRLLREVATNSFVSQLTQTYNVKITWASIQDKDVLKDEDWLTICYHKLKDSQNALMAERDILLAEHRRLPRKKVTEHEERISMWIPAPGTKPNFVPHQSSKESNSSTPQNVWSRWVLPQEPVQLIQGGPIDAEAKSPGLKLKEFSFILNRQLRWIHKLLTGKNDEFFPVMKLKRRTDIRRFLDSGRIKEEIFVNFGKIVFSNQDMTIKHDFHPSVDIKRAKLFRAQRPAHAMLLTDMPNLPNHLGSLAPYESFNSNRHTGKYRLRYIPLPPDLPPGLRAPLMEVDVSRHAEPGSTVQNHLRSAWAILDEQSHKLLTPAFTLDLEFGRRLKSLLYDRQAPNDGPQPHVKWLQKLANQFRELDENRFPPFLTMMMPRHTIKGPSYTGRVAADKCEPHLK
jgi:hypothetical protein